MRNTRLNRDLPRTHKDFEMCMQPWKDMGTVKRLGELDKLTEWGRQYDYVITATSGKVVDTDDYTLGQQRHYVRGVPREAWDNVDKRILWWMDVGNRGAINRGTLIYAYERYKTK